MAGRSYLQGERMKRLLTRTARTLIPLAMIAAALVAVARQDHHRRCVRIESGGLKHPGINCSACHRSTAPVIHQSPFPNRMVASD
jgi:hypothetical protein